MTLTEPVRRSADDWRERPDLLEALYGLTNSLLGAQTPEPVYHAAIEALCAGLRTTRASVLLFDSDGVMRFKAWRGLSSAYRQAVEGHTPWRPDTPDPPPVLVPKVEDDPELEDYMPVFRQEGISALGFFPLTFQGCVIGKFMVYFARPHTFTPAENQLAATIANHVSVAIGRQREQVRLAESEERYRALAESIPQMAVMAPPNGRIAYCNQTWTSYTGMDLAATQRGGWRRVVHPEDFRSLALSRREALDGGAPYAAELRLRRFDGCYRWHYCVSQPIRLPDGDVRGWVSTATDIHEMKRIRDRERFLSRAAGAMSSSLDFEETLRTLAALIVPEIADICAVDILDPVGGMRRFEVSCRFPEHAPVVQKIRIRDWRTRPGSDQRMHERLRAGEALLMTGIDEQWIRDVAYPPEQAGFANLIGPRAFIAVPLKARNLVVGALTLVLTTKERDYDAGDLALVVELSHRAATAIDNSRLYEETRDMAQRLTVANRAKDEFLGLVSHEMRTPITTIYGNAQVLRRLAEQISEPERGQAIRDIEQDADRLQRIIENMLVLARIEVGQHVATEPVLLPRLVNAAVKEMASKSPSRQVTVEVEAGLPPVQAQPAYLEIILRNLLGNADKYSPAGEPVVIGLTFDPDAATVCVQDRGPGVAPEELDRIFQPFYRSRRTEHAPGAGLGLAVCRRLLDAQGGTIEGHERAGGGLSVCFSIPLTPVAPSLLP